MAEAGEEIRLTRSCTRTESAKEGSGSRLRRETGQISENGKKRVAQDPAKPIEPTGRGERPCKRKLRDGGRANAGKGVVAGGRSTSREEPPRKRDQARQRNGCD